MSTRYRHTQFGTLVLWAVGVPVLVAVTVALVVEPSALALSAAALLALLLFLFHSLTVEVTESVIVARFGPGLIRKSFQVHEIREAQAVRNRWFYGWGIRLTPHGWLFNVAGLDAVQIKMENGRQYRIGTDRPEELLAAIRQVAPLSHS
jgi:hypothetical protein